MIAKIGIWAGHPIASGGSYDTDAQAYFTATEAQGYTWPAGWKTAFNTCYVYWKANGLTLGTSGDIKEAFFLAHNNVVANKVRMITPAGSFCAFSGSPTHGVNGVTTNGTSSYIDTGIGMTIASQDSAGFGIYIQTAPPANVNPRYYGGSVNINTFAFISRIGTDLAFSVNGLNNNGQIAAASQDKFVFATRTSSTSTSLYRNATSLGSYTGSSTTPQSTSMVLGGRNLSGTPSNFAAITASFCLWTAGLNSTKQGVLYTGLSTLLTNTAGL